MDKIILVNKFTLTILIIFVIINIHALTGRKSKRKLLFKQILVNNLVYSQHDLTNEEPKLEINKFSDFDLKSKLFRDAFKKLDIPIRVQIETNKSNFEWEFISENGFLLFILEDNKYKYYKNLSNINNIIFSSVNNNYYLGDQKLKNSVKKIFLIPSNLDNLQFKYNSNNYDGFCEVVFLEKTGSWCLINHVDIEDYVASVIHSESWPGWPDEINKVLSICVRTYGVSKLFEKKNINIPFDIKNNNSHQVYRGSYKPEKFKKIVESTKGLVLSWKDKPILAMFDIACGGIIPAHKLGIDLNKAPYLGRTYACGYCKDYHLSQWKIQYSIEDINNICQPILEQPGKIRDIIISKKDKSGCVTELKLSVNYKWVPISAKKFKSVFKKFKSLNFSIKKENKHIVFTGKGFGHLTGLCQRGAYKMVKLGFIYQDILRFYYPNTQLKRLIQNN